MDIHAGLSAEFYRQGIYIAQTESEDAQKLIYLVNLDCVDKTIDVRVNGEALFENFVLENKRSLILPVNVKTPAATVIKSTAEITGMDENSIVFRLSQPEDTIWLCTDREVTAGEGYETEKAEGFTVVHAAKKEQKEICVKFV